MSFYFRDKPKLGDKLRGRSSDELLQEIKQQFDVDSKSFFDPTGGGRSSARDPFERHTVFPRGFPFDDDDEAFGRRSDIRTHLDQLAARHPEFADHLLGPAWGDIPFHGSLRPRNNRRGSGNGLNNNCQGYSDEDARSQASGSSAASGASSHGESEAGRNQRERSRDGPDTTDYGYQQTAGKSPRIPQYGLRNTVDIGQQHRHNMENPDKAANRGQRSMSAPPENRQQFCQQQPHHRCHRDCQQQQSQPQPQSQEQQPRPQQGQRYVSRIDITPQHNQPPPPPPQQPQSQQPQQQQQQQQKPTSQQQSNVRHIPIFVEGRDEPVLPRSSDERYFGREPSPPTQFHAPPPHFQRSSPFGQSPFARSHRWSPPFQDPFYPTQTGYEQPSRRQQQQQQPYGFQHPRQQQQQYNQSPSPPSPPSPPQQHEKQAQPQQHKEQYAQHQEEHPSQQHEQQEAPPPPPRLKPVVPKDPLERVAMVQKEVDSLAEQVKRYSGSSRKDKEYIYLDEMLTRELIKLDDIETEGRENVRQARKNAIKTIQETIGLLESMTALASQPATPQQTEKPIIPTGVDDQQFESMDVDRKQEEQQQRTNNEAIPLPPGPSSPLNNSGATVQEEKEKEKDKETEEEKEKEQEKEKKKKKKKSTSVDAEQPSNTNTPIDDNASSVEPMDTTTGLEGSEKPEEKPAGPTPMDVQESSEGSNVVVEKTTPIESTEAKIGTDVAEVNAREDQQKVENDSCSATSNVVPAEKSSSRETTTAVVESDITAPERKAIEQRELEECQAGNETREADGTAKPSPKVPKKGKKAKKQSTASSSISAAPVSDTPIPLPPPETTETSGK